MKVTDLLGDLYKKYEKLADRPIETRIKFHEINYDNIFQDLADNWAEKSASLRTMLGTAGNPLLVRMLDELSDASKTEGNFVWSHAADIVLYRLTAEVRMAIRASVARQIAAGIQEDLNARQECQFSIMAHSLGTAVAHDSLHALMAGTEAVGGKAFSPPNTRAVLLMQVANVSRALETAPDVYQSHYQPGPFSDAGPHGANYFFNCRHVLDPFTVLRKFNPIGWPADCFREIEVRHLHDKNVHGFQHYLENPAVHIPFFRAVTNDLAGFRKIRKSDEAAAIQDFKDVNLGNALELASALSKSPFAMADTWEKMSEVGKWFGGILQRF